MRQYRKKQVYLSFLKGKSKFKVFQLFEKVELGDTNIYLSYDNTTKLLSPIGYLGITHPIFCMKKNIYLEILNVDQRNSKVELMILNLRRGTS